MNLFNFIRFKSIEKPTENGKNNLFRLAQRRNQKFVLVDNSGKIVSEEFDWISSQTRDEGENDSTPAVRLAEKDGLLYYIKDVENSAKAQIISGKTPEGSEQPEVYAGPEENGTRQIFLQRDTKDYSTLFLGSDKQMSDVYLRVTPENKNGLRIGWLEVPERIEVNALVTGYGPNHFTIPSRYKVREARIISKDGMTTYQSFTDISEPDENGVRTGYAHAGIEKVSDRQSVITHNLAFIPQNFGKEVELLKHFEKFDGDKYRLTYTDGKQSIVNQNGVDVAGGKYSEIQDPNALGEVIARRGRVTSKRRGRVKSNGGIILVHQGKRYKKVDEPHRVIDSAQIGIKAMKYGTDLNQNVVAGVNISEGLEIDEDVNRILISMLKGEKPSPRFWKSVEEHNKFDELFAGISAYEAKLDEIAAAKPELADEIKEKKQNLSKSVSSVLRRKVAGHRTYEKNEDKKITQHEENISNSTTAREKITEAVNNFENGK